MITSRVTSKAHTTIPQPICAALHLKEGDELAYEIILSKVKSSLPKDDPFGEFVEWDGEADRKAYADL